MKWLRIMLEDKIGCSEPIIRFNSSKGRTSKNYYESLVQTFYTKPLSNDLQKEKAYLFFLFSFHCPFCWGSFTKGKRRDHGHNYSTNKLFLPINIFFAHLPLITCWRYRASNKLLIRNKGLDFTFEYQFCEEEHKEAKKKKIPNQFSIYKMPNLGRF